jgi:hypothetical protein
MFVCMSLLLKMNTRRFLLAYGSQTGQSQSIAQGMVDVAREQHQLCADVFELDDIDKQVRHTKMIIHQLNPISNECMQYVRSLIVSTDLNV